MNPPTREQNAHAALLSCNVMSDIHLQITHLVASGDWGKVTDYILMQRRQLDELAGLVTRLLPKNMIEGEYHKNPKGPKE